MSLTESDEQFLDDAQAWFDEYEQFQERMRESEAEDHTEYKRGRLARFDALIDLVAGHVDDLEARR